jgi:serine phosphatase RsbU (regulator of sigma subunit)
VECSVKVTEHVGRPAVVLYMRDIRERLRLQQEIAERNALVELQNNELLSGLRYAQGIQQAMLPSLSQVRSGFMDAFILYRPRDIVSGDFYWSAQAGQKSILAVADCTGHGVPGALLSMTGITLLQGIVNGRGITSPARVLGELRSELLRSLAHQEGDPYVRDGMNIGIISYDRVTRECEFSGALCPLYIVRANGGGLEEVKGDRLPVGYHEGTMRDFTPHLIMLQEGDRLFLGSDGFADQFGGPQGRKLKTAGMKEMIARVTGDNLCLQGRALEHGFLKWKGGLDQLDDVTLVGVRV